MARPALSGEQLAATRAQLLDAAQELFEEGGLDAMSFRAIAQRAGCSHTKPYSYFDDKSDLVDHLRIRAYRWLEELLEEAASLAADPLDALDRLASAYVDAGLARPRMYELLYTSDGSSPETSPELLAAKLDSIGVCERVIREIDESGLATFTADPTTSAHVFWAAAHGLVSLHHGGFLVVGRRLDQLMPTLFAGVTTGLTTTLPAGPKED